MTTIRRTRADDVSDVAALVAGSWRRTYAPLMGEERAVSSSADRHLPQEFLKEIDDRRYASFVAAADDGTIVGHAMAERLVDGDVWLERLHIEPAHFGSGLAADLLHATIAAFTGEANLMSLEVLEGNHRAVAFYRKQGFEVAERKDACGGIEGVPTLVMKRVIARA